MRELGSWGTRHRRWVGDQNLTRGSTVRQSGRPADRSPGAGIRTAAEVDRPGTDKTATSVTPDSAAGPALQWGPAPPGLPAGGRAAIVEGDPTKAGPFTVRLDMPKGYEVRPHHHPTSEPLTLIEGALMLGHGKQWDDGKLAPLAVGAGANLAAREPHFVRAKEQSIVEVRSTGPFQIIYESPGDDPRKAPMQ